MHLHGSLPDDTVFKLKVHGRPFFGNCMAVIFNFSLIKRTCQFIKTENGCINRIIILKLYNITGKDQVAVGIVPLHAQH